jgi:tRNA U34 5-methylaminomethyl-2-thiouridine-forming methyltransferase MnmC
VHGAVQESEYIFIRSGFRMWVASVSGLPEAGAATGRILEVGLGTALNAFLTLRECEQQQLRVSYYAIERHPLDVALALSLNYPAQVWPAGAPLFEALHTAPWGQPVQITPRFTLHKVRADVTSCPFPPWDLVYFDAFSPERQPELWEAGIFHRLAEVAAPEAVLVTYCAKGQVRRNLQAAAFDVCRLPGPPGKRHILFAKYRHSCAGRNLSIPNASP